MSTRKKQHLNTKDISVLRHDDTEKLLQLQNMQLRAQKEEKPQRPLNNAIRTSKLDEKYLMRDNTENAIRAKLDRIGYNSRITPEELAQKKGLSRPEQAEIDTYNLRKEANANLVDEVPPTMLPIPRSEEDWEEIGDEYALEPLMKEKGQYEQAIERTTNEIESLKKKGVLHGINNNIKKGEKNYEKAQKSVTSSISNNERDLRNYVSSLKKVNTAIASVKDQRRRYVVSAETQNKEEMENYLQQISVLTSYGLSTQRLPNESDDDYLQRMHDNVQDITTQEQLFDGSLFLLKEFMAKLRSLNLSLDKVESIAKLTPDDGKEWILSHWPKVTKDFVKSFGTNPYRVKVEDVVELFVMMHNVATASTSISNVSYKQYKDELAHEYDDEFLSSHPPNFERKASKAAREEILQRRSQFESSSAYDSAALDDLMDDYDNEYEDATTRALPATKYTPRHKRHGPFVPAKPAADDDDDNDPDDVGYGFRKLGKKIINYDKLTKRNVLDVRHLKKGNIFGFPTSTVSDAFVSNVNKLVKGEGVTEDDDNALDNAEKQLFERMKHVTAVGGTYKDNKGLGTLKSRLKLIEDEIQSGNDSTHLLVEAKDILKPLARQNIITKAEKDRFYKQLSSVNN